jgi:FecR protein
VSNQNKPGVYVAWKTVTYRSVVMALVGGLLLFAAALQIVFPKFTESTLKAFGHISSGILEKIAGLAPPLKGASAGVSQQAHFTALDGTIRVRKGNGNSWINADYSVPLEKGDVVQTGAEGMAKIVFNDGTNYTVKQDSLIVIEENSANDQQQTNVSVAVTTGTVDLTTATYVQGSKSQVIVAGAKASLAPDSSAMVHNNPKDDQHEILMKKGGGEIERNGEGHIPERIENHGARQGNWSA